MILSIILCLAIFLWSILYYITRPEPPPTCVEEEIMRVAINKINWRRRPSIDEISLIPHGGLVMSIGTTDMRKLYFEFTEGKVCIRSFRSGRKDFVDIIDLARPDSIELLSNKIEHHYIKLLYS